VNPLASINLSTDLALVEARGKVRTLAEDLGAQAVAGTAVATIVSDVGRRAIKDDLPVTAELAIEAVEGRTIMQVRLSGVSALPEVEGLRSRFGIEAISSTAVDGGRPSVELRIPTSTPAARVDEAFLDRERARLIQRSPGQLLEEVQRQNVELSSLLEELRDTKNALALKARELETVNRELESFSYSVSHDLRAPLRAVDGFGLALLEDYDAALDETGKDYLRRIRAATARMARLIDDLLSLSRLTRDEMHVGRVDLSRLAEEIVAELREGEPGRNVDVTITPGLEAEADAALTRVVLVNLLGNAFKFTDKRDPARIAFGAETVDGRLWYCVEDNGAGFDMTYADKLFGAFQRLHTTDEFDGTGIGLAIVQRAIHRQGGEVRAWGEIGTGAKISFCLASPRIGG